MFYHIVLHYLALYLLELMAVVVITQLHASGSNLLTYLIVEIADGLEVSKCLRNIAPGNYHITHACTLVGIDALVPPLQSFCKVLALQLVVIQIASNMAGEHLQSCCLNISLELLG